MLLFVWCLVQEGNDDTNVRRRNACCEGAIATTTEEITSELPCNGYGDILIKQRKLQRKLFIFLITGWS